MNTHWFGLLASGDVGQSLPKRESGKWVAFGEKINSHYYRIPNVLSSSSILCP